MAEARLGVPDGQRTLDRVEIVVPEQPAPANWGEEWLPWNRTIIARTVREVRRLTKGLTGQSVLVE